MPHGLVRTSRWSSYRGSEGACYLLKEQGSWKLEKSVRMFESHGTALDAGWNAATGARSPARQSTRSKAQNEIANCSWFLRMPTTGIPPQNKVVADLATGDSRANMKSLSSFCSNPSNRDLNNSPQGTKCNIDILLFPDHLLSVEKWYWSACIVILKFTLKICKTAPYVLEPDTAPLAPTNGKVLLVNAALMLNYAMLLYGNSIKKKSYFQCWFFFSIL